MDFNCDIVHRPQQQETDPHRLYHRPGLVEPNLKLVLEIEGQSYPERPGEPNCNHYLRTGYCGYGNRCRFNHPVYPERPGEPDCLYYLRTGNCGFGHRCRFNHPHLPSFFDLKDPHLPSTSLANRRFSGEDYPIQSNQPICEYYRKTGSCKHGTSCNYHHPNPSTPYKQGYPIRPGKQECKYFIATGKCKFRMSCKFHHPPLSYVPVTTVTSVMPHHQVAPTRFRRSVVPSYVQRACGSVSSDTSYLKDHLSTEDSSTFGPQSSSSGVQKEFFWRKDSANFIAECSTTSKGTLDTIFQPKMYSKLDILALVLIAKNKIRARVREARKILHEPMLTCCLFPHNHEIERETLIQLWMAGGFLEDARLKDVVFQHMGRPKGKTTHMEDVGNCCIDLFEKRKLISASRTHNQTGKMTYIINLETIKNLLDEVSTSTKDLYTMIKDRNATNGSMQSWHVSLAYDDFDQTTFKTLRNFHELRTLLFIPNYGSSLKQIPSTFFLVIKLLRALDLSGSYITELPISVGNLTKLRYLDCSFTPLEGLPESIGRLHELQTLKLKECNHLFELPKGMKNLVSLRHLDFDVLGQLTSMPQGIGALTELRTLSAFIVGNNNGPNIRELKYLNNLSGSICISGLENLCQEVDVKVAALHRKNHISKLQLRWNSFQDKGLEIQQDSLACIDELIPNVCLEELQLLCYPLSRLPHWMADEEFKNIVSITLLKCENIELNTSLGELPNLKYLDITQMNGVTKIDCCFRGQISYPAFWALETLIIDGMSTLEKWEDVKTYDFPCLLKLIIKHCPKLIELPFLPINGSLKHLEISRCKSLQSLPKQKLPDLVEKLIINECPLLKLKCSKDGEDWDKIAHVPNIWIDLKDIRSHQDDCSEDDGWTTDSLSDNIDFSEDSDIAGLTF